MFRVLNLSLAPRVAMTPAGDPDVWFGLHGGEHFVFDSNSLCLAHVDAETWAGLKSLGGDGAAVHGLNGLMFSRNKPQFPFSAPGPVRHVVLNVTHACNLACTYCFVDQHRPARTEHAMSLETALAGVRLIPPGSAFNISFFGGEPLLEWDLVKSVMTEVRALASARKVAAKFHITTNAALLDAEKMAFLADQPCSLLVSLDGPEDLHNATRPTRTGQGSWALAMRALELAATTPLRGRIMARATFLTAEPRLRERLEFFADLHDSRLINGYSVEPAILTEGCAAQAGRPMDLNQVLAAYHGASQWFVERVLKGRSAGFFHYRKILERLLYSRHSASECGAGKGYVTVAPDGTIHACHREGTPVGHVSTGFDEASRAAWMENRLYRNDHCRRCWLRWLCGGGCREACLAVAGDMRAQVPDQCLLKRTMILECFWIASQLTSDHLRAAIPDAGKPRRKR